MKAIDVAIGFAQTTVGLKEIRGNQGFKNAWFEKKMTERGFEPGNAWCALYLEFVFYETYQGTKYEDDINRLFSKSAVQTWYNFHRNGPFQSDQAARPGDMVFWRKYNHGVGSWQGHCGIVVEVSLSGFKSIEGNGNSTGGREGIEVVEKERDFGIPETGLRILGFVHPDNIEI